MASKRSELIAMGVDPRVAGRETYPVVNLTENGVKKNCRDRQPWGGVTDPDRCSCVGACIYDTGAR